MAIVKSITFQGSPIQDVDVDVETWARVMKNAQGDLAGTLDDLTSTSAANPIDHRGPGRGALLGIPWVNQFCDLVVDFDATGAKNGGAQSAASGGTVQFPWFVRVEPGETSVLVEVTIGTTIPPPQWAAMYLPRVRLCSASNFGAAAGATLDLPLVPESDNLMPMRLTALHTGVTTPGLYLAVVMMESVSVLDAVPLVCGLVDCTIRKPRNGIAVVDVTRDPANPVPVFEPGASQALFHQSMDDALFVSGEPLTGWHTTRIDRNANGLEENLAGAPAGTNQDYTHTESSLENPTRDRFHSPNRKTFASKPIPIIPVVSHCFGGIKSGGGYLVDPASAPSVAARKAFAPYPTSAAARDMGGVVVRVPDVPSTMLRWAALVGQSSVTGFGPMRATARLGTLPTKVTPTALTGASHLGLSQGSGLVFTADDVALLLVQLEDTGGTYDPLDLCLLSVCLWVEP